MGALHMQSTVGPSWNCFLQHASQPQHNPKWSMATYARCRSLELKSLSKPHEMNHLIDPIRRSFSYASKIQLQFARKKQVRGSTQPGQCLRQQFIIDLAAQLFLLHVITQSARMVSKTCKDHQQIAFHHGEKKGTKVAQLIKDTISNDRENIGFLQMVEFTPYLLGTWGRGIAMRPSLHGSNL